VKTEVKKKTLNPQWNQTFEFEVKDASKSEVTVEVWDWDRFGSAEFMGQAIIPLSGYSAASAPVENWFTLQRRTAEDAVAGAVRLRLTFDELKRPLSNSNSNDGSVLFVSSGFNASPTIREEKRASANPSLPSPTEPQRDNIYATLERVGPKAVQFQTPVDPIVPPAEWRAQLGWQGRISREDAEAKLHVGGAGTYLLRYSDNAKSYVLSFVTKSLGYVHMSSIIGDNGSAKIKVVNNFGKEEQFSNLLTFIESTKRDKIISKPVPI
jgi:hypothetical protein